MKLVGEQAVPAGQARTWQALNDPEILRQCIPGCEAIVPEGEQTYRVEMATRIGPVSARFKGRLRLLDIDEPRSYRLEFDGQGGAAGFGKGKAGVRLEPEGEQSRLHYEVEATVGGKLAQVGSRLIDSAARKLSEDFFSRFNEVLAQEQAATASAAAVAAAPVAVPIPAAAALIPASVSTAAGPALGTAAAGGAPSRKWGWLLAAGVAAAGVAAGFAMR